MNGQKITAAVIRERKIKGVKITMLTAYDYAMAALLDEAGVDIILVGDSLGNVVLGHESTLPVTMEEMLHHTKAVSRGTKRALLIGDMPFLSYQISDTEAMHNAGRFLKEAGAEGIKLEGGREMAALIRKMTSAGIPVMGHLGLTPQSVLQFGGYKIQGREEAAANRIMEDARIIEDAGVFAVVLECVPAPLAGKITKALGIPTIGIGAGVDCDGQVLVINDLLGMFAKFKPKFVKRYCNLDTQIKDAVRQYVEEVQNSKFPDEEHSLY